MWNLETNNWLLPRGAFYNIRNVNKRKKFLPESVVEVSSLGLLPANRKLNTSKRNGAWRDRTSYNKPSTREVETGG